MRVEVSAFNIRGAKRPAVKGSSLDFAENSIGRTVKANVKDSKDITTKTIFRTPLSIS